MSTEFLGLMKKVAKSPAVLEVVNIPNVQKQLDRLADLLNKIQKALGEYLERERASFPRYVPPTDGYVCHLTTKICLSCVRWHSRSVKNTW